MLPYSFINTPYANPGSENYAFVPNMTLPKHSVGGGASLTVDSYRVVQGQQSMIYHAVPTGGYGGLVAGQLIGQPLSE